jgi:hypothetical protein
MNDRIKELLQKSMVEHQFDVRLDPERLIKLTVRECVKALWTEDCHVSDLAIIDFNEKKRKIYEHMGVTE